MFRVLPIVVGTALATVTSATTADTNPRLSAVVVAAHATVLADKIRTQMNGNIGVLDTPS